MFKMHKKFWLFIIVGISYFITPYIIGLIFNVPKEGLSQSWEIIVAVMVWLFGDNIIPRCYSYVTKAASNSRTTSNPNYYDYHIAEYKGIYWVWQWYGNSIENLTALCPKCLQRLDTKDSYYVRATGMTHISNSPLRYYCDNDNCHYETDYVDYDKAFKEIERRIRTGEYKEDMKNFSIKYY